MLDQARDGDGAATDTFLLSACRAYLEGRVSPTGSRAAASAYRYLVARAGGYDDGVGVEVLGAFGGFLTLRVKFMPGCKVQTIL